MQPILKFLLMFFVMSTPLLAQDSSTEDLGLLTAQEIQNQMNFMQGALSLEGERGRIEIEERAKNIAELFFSKPLRSYLARTHVFAIAENIQVQLERILSEEENAMQLVVELQLALLEVEERVQASSEYEDSVWTARKRALFGGFLLSPGLYLGAFILSDAFAFAARTVDFAFRAVPLEGSLIVRNGYLWAASKAYEMNFWRWKANEEKAQKCRDALTKATEHRKFKRDRLAKDLDHAWKRWQKRLNWRRMSWFFALGGGASLILYNVPLPVVDTQALEDQHDWDAQEDAIEKILLPFFKTQNKKLSDSN